MSRPIVFLSAAAVLFGATVLPGVASAADYYDGGEQHPAFHGHGDWPADGDRFEQRQGPRPADGYRRGPVVFDEREIDRRVVGPVPGDGERGYRRPGRSLPPAYAEGEEGQIAFAPRGGFQPYGGEPGSGYRPAPLYRAAGGPVGPAFGEDGPDVGCTTEQAQTTTPAGWRKIVTHRTCYRR